MNWLITDRGDQDVRRLADKHYTRQTVGSPQFTRNGQNLVFITDDARAAWITFRPTPGIADRRDGLDAWECALFRNEGPLLSSALIIEATALTFALWGAAPPDGLITFVRPDAVRSQRLKRRGVPFARPPGWCYLRAGWTLDGAARDGKPRLRAPAATEIADWRAWRWRGDRGGKLRSRLECLPGLE